MAERTKSGFFSGISRRVSRAFASTSSSSNTPPSPSENKHKCGKCGRKLHYRDTHMACYQCLGAFHQVNKCGPCSKMSKSARSRRQKAMDIFLATGVWPKTLESIKEDSSSYKTTKSSTQKSKSKKSKTESESVIIEEDTAEAVSTPQGDIEVTELIEKIDLAPEHNTLSED